MPAKSLPQIDVLIAGAGIIGLTLALELDRRGARVTVLEWDAALSHASVAAAGMLAVEDPANPPALLPLSRHSRALYPGYLARVEALSGMAIPFQTETAWQYAGGAAPERLAEYSLDPRQLAEALLAAVRATGVRLIENAGELDIPESGGVHADALVHCSGAWFGGAVRPRKGQMLRVQLPVALAEVHRSERVYVVPRTQGPQAGTALIGATVEDAGFDTTVHPRDLARLRMLAAELLPFLGDEERAPQLEAWAGLRPTTVDELPLLGRIGASKTFVATGHFRNGILLAPGTADVMADLVEGKAPVVDLGAFAVERFGTGPRKAAREPENKIPPV